MRCKPASLWGAFLWASLLAIPTSAQEPLRLTAEAAVRSAVERSPAVLAAQSRLDASAASVRGARAPFNVQGELAPGVGFTNGNAALSQQIDIGGRRSAETRAAEGLQAATQAELDVVRLQVATEASTAYYGLVRAREVERAARETADLARQLQDAVRRRVEIGEAPQVQVTRAEIEAARADQEVTRAQGQVRAALAQLNVLLGRPAEAPVDPTDRLTVPEAPAPVAELVEQAQRQRPELAAGEALVEARRGEVEIARSQRRPTLFAELATDIWSLDRDPFNSRNVGIQARLSFPLFDRGRLRAQEDRAHAGVREQQAELAATRQRLELEIERAVAELAAARDVAVNYQDTILPRTQELLRMTRAGFDVGLTSFLEVLEAQRVVRQAQTEYQNALFDAVRAQVMLERALGDVSRLTAPTHPSDRRSPR